MDLLKDINRRFGLTILLITHEMEVIRAIADRVVVLDKGRVVEEGPVWQIFANPQAETTVSLLQSIRPELPEHLAAILSPYAEGDAVLRITVSGAQATQPLIADLVATFGVAARLLHGGVTHIQGQPVGHLFLALPAASQNWRDGSLPICAPTQLPWMFSDMSPALIDLLLQGLLETIVMTIASGGISLLLGLPLGLVLVATDRDGIWENEGLNRVLGAIVNALRSVPFIILLVALIPVTRLIVGTSIGVGAAIVPLTVAATPYYARIAEVSLREVDHGLIDAARAMGGNRWTIIREVLVPEALPGLVAGFTVTLVTLIGASAMAGAVGAGGLGDLAVRYGYQRFETDVMIAVVVVLIVLVCGLQWLGDRTAKVLDHR